MKILEPKPPWNPLGLTRPVTGRLYLSFYREGHYNKERSLRLFAVLKKQRTFEVVDRKVLHRALDGKKRGITWRLQETLEDMEYADDVCLVSHKYEHMQRKLDALWKESKKAGLEVNSSKTEEIRVNTVVNQGLKLNGEDHHISVIWVVL